MSTSASKHDCAGIACVTSSIKLDAVILVSFFVLLITASYFLRVYYRVTVIDVRVEYTNPEGTIKTLHRPAKFIKNRLAVSSTDKLLRNLEEEINNYMQSSGWYLYYLYKEPGARIDWIIRYSYNTTNLNQQKVVSFDENSKF